MTEPPFETWTIAVEADTSQLQSELRAAASLGRQFSNALIGAFEGVALKGKSVGDVLKSLSLRLSEIVLKAAMKPLEQGIGNLLAGLISGGLGGAGAAAEATGGSLLGLPLPFAKGGTFKSGLAIPFANGGAFAGGLPVPFASGGVIASPIAFPLDGGRIGIAGERGAEAIMPLARGPDGRLGVVARGGAGASVTVNIHTPDVEGFRRSQTQVAAMLARAVGAGQRNL